MKGSTRNIYIKYCNRTKLWRVLVVAEAKLLDLFSLNFVKMLSLPWVSLKISGYLLQQYSNILTNWILEITRNRNQKFEWIRTLWQKRTDPALKIRKWEWEIRVERSHPMSHTPHSIFAFVKIYDQEKYLHYFKRKVNRTELGNVCKQNVIYLGTYSWSQGSLINKVLVENLSRKRWVNQAT